MVLERRLDLVELALTTDEAGQVRGQVVCKSLQRPQRREVDWKSLGEDLVHPRWLGQVPERMQPQVEVVQVECTSDFLGSTRNQYLPPVTGVHQAGTTDHLRPEYVT